ncbi:hypothetical protein IP79_00145 [Porphyrobacter sp. AAP60]|nr:hypothetical protein IP79_00145 [Porphyrobacter sp. AAP60]
MIGSLCQKLTSMVAELSDRHWVGSCRLVLGLTCRYRGLSGKSYFATRNGRGCIREQFEDAIDCEVVVQWPIYSDI